MLCWRRKSPFSSFKRCYFHRDLIGSFLGPRLSVLNSFLPHHHYIGTGHTYLIPLNTINMTLPKPPAQNPVDIPFENGIILTTTINPITCRHSIQCDLCEVIIDLGISAPTFQYIVLFAPSSCHSQGTHRPSGNIMLSIV